MNKEGTNTYILQSAFSAKISGKQRSICENSNSENCPPLHMRAGQENRETDEGVNFVSRPLRLSICPLLFRPSFMFSPSLVFASLLPLPVPRRLGLDFFLASPPFVVSVLYPRGRDHPGRCKKRGKKEKNLGMRKSRAAETGFADGVRISECEMLLEKWVCSRGKCRSAGDIPF